LAQLEPRTRDLAIQLVNAARDVGVPLIITSSRRSVEEQRRLVEAGRSRTMNSAHLRGEAFDVDVMGLRRDDIPRWWFSALGAYGESLGLVWGGRWSFYDPGHFELDRRPTF
jgi:uncharacterized protein YcbK (DUF882 family)